MALVVRDVFKPHVHSRRGALLNHVWPKYASDADYVIPQPNPHKFHLTTLDRVATYLEEHEKATPEGCDCEALGSLYVNERTQCDVLAEGFRSGIIVECKIYPKGGTTESDEGVSNVRDIAAQLDTIQQVGGVAKFHGTRIWKNNGDPVDPYQEEPYFMAHDFPWLRRNFPRLKIVLAHASTRATIDAVYGDESGLTIMEAAPHHMLAWRLMMLRATDCMNPMYGCRPLLAEEEDMLEVLKFSTSGDPRVMIGSDEAPHPGKAKSRAVKASCGLYFSGLELLWYATAFARAGHLFGGNRLDHLQAFVSRPYEIYTRAGKPLPRKNREIRLVEKTWTVDELEPITGVDDALYPFGYHPEREFRIPCVFKYA